MLPTTQDLFYSLAEFDQNPNSAADSFYGLTEFITYRVNDMTKNYRGINHLPVMVVDFVVMLQAVRCHLNAHPTHPKIVA
jgi:hypothetical protein